MIDRVLVGSDILMTKEKEQASNRRWLLDLIRNPIKRATGLTPARFGSAISIESHLSRARFFELSGILLDPDQTQFWYDDSLINKESESYLAAFLRPTDLFIGYELSPQTRRMFDRIGVAWIDIWLHPIRFLDDLLFGFSASSPAVYAAMQEFHLDDDQFYLYGDRLRIQYYKGYNRRALPLKPESALFIGQTLEDKAVCDRGRMLSVLDYKDQFEAIGKEYGTVYYSRHPYVRGGDEAILDYVRSCGFAEFVDYPAYHMLASGRIGKVFSISSSLIHEAKYLSVLADFLFEPPMRFGTQYGEEYLSIYQSFVSPHFWSAVLAPLCETQPCKPIMYLSGKDKLRDMLNFYWSYRHIDKNEQVRQTVWTLSNKVQKMEAVGKEERPKELPPCNSASVDNLSDAIIAHDVISFDIFDTLIERPLEVPNDLFDLMEPSVKSIVDLKDNSFRKLREQARHLVKQRQHGEEITLDERYSALVQAQGWSAVQAQQLQHLEEEWELKLCRTRDYGKTLYDLAVQARKKIFLTSDTFFSQAFIERLLKQNGFEGPHLLLLSSVEGKLKRTTALFNTLIEQSGVNPDKILHIGDDAVSDLDKAREAGLHAVRIPTTTEVYKNMSRLSCCYRSLPVPLSSALHGVISKNYLKGRIELPRRSFSCGTIETLGYGVIGPFFFGFAKWVIEQAIQDGVETLYFLARDGAVIKRCYDVLAPLYPKAAKSVYLYASRRGLHVASISSERDIVERLEKFFNPSTVSDLFKYRLGLETIPLDALNQFGYTGPQSMVSAPRDRKTLIEMARVLAPAIFENAAQERQNLLAYFQDQGLGDKQRHCAVVDIGHHGTLQKAIANMTGHQALDGYYFATYKEIETALEAEGFKAKAYVGDKLDGKDKTNPYVCFLLMFEAMFLNDEGSFVKIEKRDEGWTPLTLDTSGEVARIDFARQLHDAAVSFTREMAHVLGAETSRYFFPGETAIGGYVSMLRSPSAADAELFKNIQFENFFSGPGYRRLLRLVPDDLEETINGSIWKQGAVAVMTE